MIINREELVKFHQSRSTRLALDALEAAIKSVKPETLVKRAVRFDGKTLSVRSIGGEDAVNVEFDNAYVVGAGKAAAGMMLALSAILNNRLATGAITVPYGTKIKINNNNNNKKITITEASHPVPDRSGIVGTKKILEILKQAKRGDLVIVLISGGGSALMPMPSIGISLSDKQRMTNMLLRSGASIHEMNIVRKHLSAVKGGQMLRYIDRSCNVVSLIISDVIDDDLDVIASGPTCPDNSNFKDALKILKKYNLANSSDPVFEHIERGIRGEIPDTPKSGDPIFSNTHNVIIGNNTLVCKNISTYLQERGLRPVYLGSRFDGSASDFGKFLARLTSDLAGAPFAIIAGGETTVLLNKSRNGMGGRNQEAAVAYAIAFNDHYSEQVPNHSRRLDYAAAFIGTDGIDGNSDAAGALISQKTVSLSKRMPLQKFLDWHDSYHALKKMNSLIFTGYTGTNVNDIALLIYQ